MDVALFISPTTTASISQLFLMDTEQSKRQRSHSISTQIVSFPSADREIFRAADSLFRIVGGESYEASKGHREREEDLRGSVQPNLWRLQDFPLREAWKQHIRTRRL